MASQTEKVKVLYIGGYGRSGSTLLLRALGQIDGFFAVGEMWNIWQRSFTENELCGCGQPFKECSFWQSVVEEAFGGFESFSAEHVKTVKSSIQNNLNLHRLAFQRFRTPEFVEQMEAYTNILKKLYRAIQKISGCRVIVDSSKGPRYAYMLNQVSNLDLYLLHLVRDSRAVAYSWQKKKIKPEVYWQTKYMDRPSLVRSALNWNIVNLIYDGFKQAHKNFLTLFYEDFIQKPYPVFEKIAAFSGEAGAKAPFSLKDNAVHFGSDHTAVGNPNRFNHGLVELRLDTEWQRRMPRGQQLLVTALTWPLLRRYGYLKSLPGASPESVLKENAVQQDLGS